MKDGEAIIHPWVNKALERAQAKVEGRNFDIRKNLLKFDDVMNDQRKAIFSQRREIMESEDVSEITRDMRHEVIDDLVTEFVPRRAYADQWNSEGLYGEVVKHFGIDLPVMQWAAEEGVDDEVIRERLYKETDKAMAKKATDFGTDAMRQVEKQVLLQTIDERWREHLLRLDHLRSVVGFRGYAQRDPLNEYKTESFGLFEGLLNKLRGEVTSKLAHVQIMTQEQQAQMVEQMRDWQKHSKRSRPRKRALWRPKLGPKALLPPQRQGKLQYQNWLPELTRMIQQLGPKLGEIPLVHVGQGTSLNTATARFSATIRTQSTVSGRRL